MSALALYMLRQRRLAGHFKLSALERDLHMKLCRIAAAALIGADA